MWAATTGIVLLSLLLAVHGKSTIEPCSGADACPAMAGYTLYAPLKVAEVASLFQVDPVALIAANAYDVSYPDLENHILPAGLFLKVPLPSCSCRDGIRKSRTTYRTRPSDTLASISGSVYSGLISPAQIADANGISDPSALDVGQTLDIPLPCTCFNSSDNGLPAVYLSYVVREGDSVSAIAAEYYTTVTDVMAVNAMGSMAVKPGDILAIPLPACASSFQHSASDFNLIVPNGSYAITASHCIQCSCGPGNLNLYCTPAALAVSCSSMQCRQTNLMLGNVTSQQTSAGCSVTSCSYDGFVNGTIWTALTTSLQPRCPGVHQFPPVIPPPTALSEVSAFTPSPSPSEPGGVSSTPNPGISGTPGFIGVSPANGPSGSSSNAPSLVKELPLLSGLLLFCFIGGLIL